MKMIFSLSIFISISIYLYSQPAYLEEPELFELPLGEPIGGFALENNTIPISLSENSIAFVYYAYDWNVHSSSLLFTLSIDSGKTWSNPNVIETGGDGYASLAGLKTNSNRLIVIWRLRIFPIDTLKMAYSDDGGNSWNINTITALPNPIYGLKLSQTDDQKLWLIYSKRKQSSPNDQDIYYISSIDNGNNWNTEVPLLDGEFDQYGGVIISGSLSEVLFFYNDNSSGDAYIYKKTSVNGGLNWSASFPVLNSNTDEYITTSMLVQPGGTIWVFYSYYNDDLPFINSNADIHYVKSSDFGNIWESPVQFTYYAGPDATPRTAVLFNKPFITFSSTRWSGDYFAWFALIGFTEDNNPHPIGNDNNFIPTSFKLSQNFPNPFNPTTKIKYSVSEISFVTLKVYDVLGKEVATLINEEKLAGSYEINFDASSLSSGIYFYKLQAGSFTKTNKMILLR